MSSPRPVIAPLPPDEVQKICAGEVVERPLSVVKELVENALDAGATEISVELEEGGKRLIRVIDNGSGIAAGQLELAVSPHCTSKIRSLDELYSTLSLGFRGEALASIGAVSRLRLSSYEQSGQAQPSNSSPESRVLSPDEELPPPTSAGSAATIHRSAPDSAIRTQDSGLRTVLAASIEVHGGQSQGLASSQLKRGTEVEVSDLFYNVPARLKFLRSSQSEASQIAGLLTAYALAWPEVRWKLTALDARGGPKLLLASDGDGDQAAVLRDLLGGELAEGMARIDFEWPPLAARGYVSAPHRHWHNRTRQWFFVNRRPVVNKLLYRAVDDALREFLSPGKFPAGVFMLEIPPEEIDVNVHPAKTEISFAQPQAVYSLLVTALKRALGAAAASRQRELTRGLSSVVSPVEPQRDAPPAYTIQRSAGPLLETEAPPGHRSIPVYDPAVPLIAEGQGSGAAGLGDTSHSPASRPPFSGSTLSELDPRPPTPDSFPIPNGGQVQQIADSYLVISTASEIYLIDQHAAHERVLFEHFWERLDPGRQQEAPQRQRLLFPMLIPLSPAEATAAEDALPALARLGFAAQLGIGSQLVIDEVPALLAGRVSAQLLQAVLGELADPARMSGEALELAEAPVGADPAGAGQSPRPAPASKMGADSTAPLQRGIQSAAFADRMKYLAASIACKAAIKAGQPLPAEERQSLLRLILSRWSSLTCPHGRPTVLRLGPGELERMFLR